MTAASCVRGSLSQSAELCIPQQKTRTLHGHRVLPDVIDHHVMVEPGSLGQASAPRSRSWANAFIALFLAYQVGMPLSYYLSDRVHDERFSWRMFSTVRLQECDVQVHELAERSGTVRERPVVVERDLQIAWIGLLKRLRPAVVEKYLRQRCERAHAQQVTLQGQCVNSNGEAMPERSFAVHCATGQWSTDGEP
ncbi:MAG TPA: hypothetical protein VF331_01810 [Polyangiales bacterium]